MGWLVLYGTGLASLAYFPQSTSAQNTGLNSVDRPNLARPDTPSCPLEVTLVNWFLYDM